MTHAIQDGKLIQLSPSMLNSFDASSAFGCERRGWFKYVKGIKEPQSASQAGGQHLHAMNEEYLKTGKLLLGTAEQTAWFKAGQWYLDTLRALQGGYQGGSEVKSFRYAVEQPLPAGFAVAGVPVSPMSKCDVVTETGIIDWKTTSDIEKYGKTPGELATDVQMLIYGKALHPEAESVTLAHGQYQTKGRARFNLASVELTRKELDTNYERVILPLVERVKSVAGENDVNNVEANRNACRFCPHQSICPSEKASTLMSIFAKLKQQQSAAPILPPDAPASKPELAAKPVENFSPVPPPKSTPTSEPSPSADLAAEAPKPTPAPEPEKKRGPGRPPGSKNKATIAAPTMEVQFESVSVNYGLTLNLGNFSSCRFDVTMGARGSDPEATYAAVMERVRAKVSEEIEKIQAEMASKQTLNPGGGK